MEPIYKQIPTIQLAPDALIFINGSDTIKDENGNVYDIRNDVTEIHTSLNVDSVPGTAGFTITMPDHSIRRLGTTRYKSLNMMSEVEIYFKGRYQKPIEKQGKYWSEENNTWLDYSDTKITQTEYPYYPAFWGMIISITENYSDGNHTISVSCADILRWWQVTEVTINPALIASTETATKTVRNKLANPDETKEYLSGGQVTSVTESRPISAYGNIYSGQAIPWILIDISRITLNDMATATNLVSKFGSSDKIPEADQSKVFSEIVT